SLSFGYARSRARWLVTHGRMHQSKVPGQGPGIDTKACKALRAQVARAGWLTRLALLSKATTPRRTVDWSFCRSPTSPSRRFIHQHQPDDLDLTCRSKRFGLGRCASPGRN